MIKLFKYLTKKFDIWSFVAIVFIASSLAWAADSKVTALGALGAAPAESDIIMIVDDPGGSPVSKKITVLNFLNALEAALTGYEIHGDNLPTAFSVFEFPNANDVTTLADAQAEAAHDNNNPGLAIHDGTNARYYATRTKCLPTIILAEPDQLQPISDIWTLMKFPAEQYPAGFVIEAIHIETSATCTDALNFEEWTNNGTAWSLGGTVEAITLSGTATEDDGTLTDATIAADAYLRLDMPASPTDIASYEITICGQIPVNN